MTAYAEDMGHVGTFQLRMLGFENQPVDHYYRTYDLSARKLFGKTAPFCIGRKKHHVIFMNWFLKLFEMYKTFPKIFFGFHSELSHDDNYPVQALDLDFRSFLDELNYKGYLNYTLLILMADHGARYGRARVTFQGRLEERMPYFSFRFPLWLKMKFPQIIRNLKTNINRLTTPYDIHKTLLEILSFSGSDKADIKQRGLSIFQEIPKERACSNAAISPHWCACIDWQPIRKLHPHVVTAVDSTVTVINDLTTFIRSVCAHLSIELIHDGYHYISKANDLSKESQPGFYSAVNQLKKTMTDNADSFSNETYFVSFRTQPGSGHFQLTVYYMPISDKFSVNINDISRVNHYGNQSECIANLYPDLRPYCFCI